MAHPPCWSRSVAAGDRWMLCPCTYCLSTSGKRVHDVRHGLLNREYRRGVVLDPPGVVLDVAVPALQVIIFGDHHAVAAVCSHVVRRCAGSRTLLAEGLQQLLGLLFAEKRLDPVRRNEKHASLLACWSHLTL